MVDLHVHKGSNEQQQQAAESLSITALYRAMVRDAGREDVVSDLEQMQNLVACMTHPSSTYTTVNHGVGALKAAKAILGTWSMMTDGLLQSLSSSVVISAVDDCTSLF